MKWDWPSCHNVLRRHFIASEEFVFASPSSRISCEMEVWKIARILAWKSLNDLPWAMVDPCQFEGIGISCASQCSEWLLQRCENPWRKLQDSGNPIRKLSKKIGRKWQVLGLWWWIFFFNWKSMFYLEETLKSPFLPVCCSCSFV